MGGDWKYKAFYSGFWPTTSSLGPEVGNQIAGPGEGGGRWEKTGRGKSEIEKKNHRRREK